MGVTGGAWHAPPPPHISFGYAGGVSPDNITEQVRLGVGVGTRVGLARVGVVRARVALLTTHYSPLTTYYFLLTAYFLLLTTHYQLLLLLTTHY